MKGPVFLTLAEVVEVHKNQIALYGGQRGVRDISLLQSAVAQPQASFSGKWLHSNIFVMASAYVFHICQNRPFIDGNKRTALASALVFLQMNNIEIEAPHQELYKMMRDLTQGKIDKQFLSQILEKLSLL